MVEKKIKILLIDDNPDTPEDLFKLAMKHFDNVNPKYCHELEIHRLPYLNGKHGYNEDKLKNIDLILLDYNFGKAHPTGANILKQLEPINKARLNNKNPKIKVIIFSDFENLHDWCNTLRQAAEKKILGNRAAEINSAGFLKELIWMYEQHEVVDFIDKDEPIALIKVKLDKARRLIEQEKTLSEYADIVKNQHKPAFIGEHQSIKKLKKIIDKVAKNDANVLILGETGTGKEVIAKNIHANSLRSKGRFITSTLALPDSMIDAELFGHEKGGFTGAEFQKKGIFEQAHKGTLFLDEIGNISPKAQQDLLRVLQEREITRIGSKDGKKIKVDFRLICATNELEEKVKAGIFREDLLFRINTIPLKILPLRERKSDIKRLSLFFLKKYNLVHDRKFRKISDDVLSLFMKYNWPGNVRELDTFIERGTLFAEESDELKIWEPMEFRSENTIVNNVNEGFQNHQDIKEKADELFADHENAISLLKEKYKDNEKSLQIVGNLNTAKKFDIIIEEYLSLRKNTIAGKVFTKDQKKAVYDAVHHRLKTDPNYPKPSVWYVGMIMGMTRTLASQYKPDHLIN